MQKFLELKNIELCLKKRTSLFSYSRHTILSDISFSLDLGETLGIVGRNGCGKSTLLRVIAGIYQPDQGELIKKPDISASLLTLGAGFDPDLSGRDNALLSSMLMGFSKKESLLRIPDIIEFSELGKHIDKPVKSYSSGMRARLGFSTGIQMNPDILLIDEVLGVGDISFRQKAERALQAKIHSDQTVVLVSHNLDVVRRVSDRVAWIDNGTLMQLDSPDRVIEAYKQFMLPAT